MGLHQGVLRCKRPDDNPGVTARRGRYIGLAAPILSPLAAGAAFTDHHERRPVGWMGFVCSAVVDEG